MPVNSIDLLQRLLKRQEWRQLPTRMSMALASCHDQEGKPLASRPMYWHYPHYSNQLGKPAGALRQGDWKLVELYENNALELYNLASDPGGAQCGGQVSRQSPRYAWDAQKLAAIRPCKMPVPELMLRASWLLVEAKHIA
ncbi:MAG: hypothetical protein WKF37_04185 [Bryobacteraceae bacterium]